MKKLVTISKYPLRYNYYVTDDGQVWSERSKKFLTQHPDKDGYMKVRLSSYDLAPGKTHSYSVHRLILENFNPCVNMEKLQVNHIDGNKANNNLSNLEWVTCEENIYHAMSNGLRAKINGAAKLTEDQVKEIYYRSNNGETNISLAKEFNLHPDSVGAIKNKKIWKQVLSDLK